MPYITFGEACILTASYCPDEYAKAYAKAGIGMTDQEEIKAQCLYILNNMGTWRTDIARLCRETFKRCSKRGEEVPDLRAQTQEALDKLEEIAKVVGQTEEVIAHRTELLRVLRELNRKDNTDA